MREYLTPLELPGPCTPAVREFSVSARDVSCVHIFFCAPSIKNPGSAPVPIPTIKTRMQTPFETPFSSCVYHRTIASTSREEGLVTAQLHCAVDPYTSLRWSVGNINAFQNNCAFIISTETCV